MSSEILGGAENTLKGNLGGAWDIKHGYADAYTDLGIARKFGGAAGAYSLRDIGAMNGPVVNVRREPYDDDNPGVTDETDFSANQVQNGALEDWVNGKLENTLPADVATAAAAYSLRKVKSDYTGNAVRVRRSADDIEADVGFDSEGNVSSSSPIFNASEVGGEAGNTTATTLGGFLSGTDAFTTTYTSDFSSGDDGFAGGTNDAPESIGGQSDAIKFTTNHPSSTNSFTKNIGSISSQKLRVSGLVYIPSSNTNIDGARFSMSTEVAAIPSISLDQWVTFTDVEIAETSGSVLTIQGTDGGSFITSPAATDVMYFKNIVVKKSISASDAFVQTWYDQTEDTTVTGNEYTSSFGSGDFDTFGDNGLDNTARENPVQGLGGFDGFALHLKVSDASTAFQVSSLGSRSYSAGDGLRFKLGLYMPSTNTDLRKIKVYTDSSNGSKRTMGRELLRPELDQWVDFEFTDIAESNIIGFRFVQDDGTLGQCAVGDEVYVRLIVIDAITKAGNNLIQDTDANQPKIASSGSLLTDGLLFDGSNDFLQTSTQVLTGTETGANSMYAVIKQTFGDAGYICGSAANSSGGQIGQSLYADGATNNKIVLTNGNDADTEDGDNIPTIEGRYFLVSSNYSNNDPNSLNTNANSVGYANGTDAYNFNAGDRFTVAARKDSTSAAAVLFNGSMKEIIAYDSDQSVNRFKIESNINNYYNLYNDDNEQQSARFSTSGGTADTSDALRNKFGFTGSGGAGGATGFFGIRLNDKLPNTETIQISFNSTKASSSSSFGVALYRGSNQSDTLAQSAVTPITKGFNSITLTSNNDDAEYITFSEDDEVVFTVSDFRVSLIARNGFVETWYDQSGNGNNATQATSTNQPMIVENGGKIDGIKFEASTNGTSNIDILQVATRLGTTTDHFVTTVINGYNTDATAFGAIINTKDGNKGYQYGIAGDSKVQAFFYDSGGNANDKASSALADNTPKTLLSFDKDGTELAGFTNGSDNGLSISNAMTTPSTTVTNIGRGGNVGSTSSNGLLANINELIVYEVDQANHRTEIEKDITNYYGI